MDRAFTEVQMIASAEETVAAAGMLHRIAFRVATARGLYDRVLSERYSNQLWLAERAFIDAARTELGYGCSP